jgi:hypothetical protein
MLKQEEEIGMSLKRVRDIVLSYQHSTLAFVTKGCKLL